MIKWIFRTPFGSPDSFNSFGEVFLHGAFWGLIVFCVMILIGILTR